MRYAVAARLLTNATTYSWGRLSPSNRKAMATVAIEAALSREAASITARRETRSTSMPSGSRLRSSGGIDSTLPTRPACSGESVISSTISGRATAVSFVADQGAEHGAAPPEPEVTVAPERRGLLLGGFAG
ncbi:hypothetical protein SCALM49S_00392 [Streptomyces californicus]